LAGARLDDLADGAAVERFALISNGGT